MLYGGYVIGLLGIIFVKTTINHDETQPNRKDIICVILAIGAYIIDIMLFKSINAWWIIIMHTAFGIAAGQLCMYIHDKGHEGDYKVHKMSIKDATVVYGAIMGISIISVISMPSE